MGERKDSSTGSAVIDGLFELDWLLLFQRVLGFFWSMIVELYWGVTRGTLPFLPCSLFGAAASLAVLYHWDYWLLQRVGIEWLYPAVLWNSVKYRVAMLFSGCLGWAFYRALKRIGDQNRARQVFESAGLKSRTGQIPKLLSRESIGNGTQRLRISRAGLSKQDFEKAKGHMESAMGVFFNSIEEDRVRGTVDITYSGSPIPTRVELAASDIGHLREGEFFFGAAHAGLKKISLSNCPHLLVAGETGSGKSTFLQQFIVSLYRQNPQMQFTLIDLKGGLEFCPFVNQPGIFVVTDREEAGRRLGDFPEMMRKRIQLLRSVSARSVEGLNNLKVMPRHIVIVDEVAEMFLSSKDGAAKSVLSQIARQGRALGIHVVMATQRPDNRSLDPQIKANLAGILCFKMLNDASSITVLGNGQATDLPSIRGRALWKFGPQITELQAPYLNEDLAKELLEDGAKKRVSVFSGSMGVSPAKENANRFKPIQ